MLDVVVITRNRRAQLLCTIAALLALPERPGVIVVDNASDDGTSAAVRTRFGDDVTLVTLDQNEGAAARNVGVQLSQRRYVAFCDDDMEWLPGSLRLACGRLDAHPEIAVVVARIVLGADRHLDPVCDELAASPLVVPGLPGPCLAGLIAGASVVRRDAFLAVGGFHPAFGVGGEETLLALDLMADGWRICYLDDLVVHHRPAERDVRARSRVVVRNRLWTAWLRYPTRLALGTTAAELRRALTSRDAAAGVAVAVRRLPWALRHRRRVPRDVAAALTLVGRAAP